MKDTHLIVDLLVPSFGGCISVVIVRYTFTPANRHSAQHFTCRSVVVEGSQWKPRLLASNYIFRFSFPGGLDYFGRNLELVKAVDNIGLLLFRFGAPGMSELDVPAEEPYDTQTEKLCLCFRDRH